MTRGPYLRLLKPATLVPVIIAASLFSLLSLHFQGANLADPHEYLLPVLVGILLAAVNFASNTIGEIFDRHEDSLHPEKKNRPVASGAIPWESALTLGLMVWGVTAGLAFWIRPMFGTLVLLILAFAYLYSAPPVRFKKRLGVNSVAVATPRGALGVLAAWVAVGGSLWDYRVLVPALVFGLYILLANESRNLDDVEADRAVGVRNFTTIYGEQVARRMVSAGAVLPIGVYTLLLYWFHLTPWFLLTAIPACVLCWASVAHKPAWSWRFTGKQVWLMFYALLGLFALTYTLPYLL